MNQPMKDAYKVNPQGTPKGMKSKKSEMAKKMKKQKYSLDHMFGDHHPLKDFPKLIKK